VRRFQLPLAPAAASYINGTPVQEMKEWCARGSGTSGCLGATSHRAESLRRGAL